MPWMRTPGGRSAAAARGPLSRRMVGISQRAFGSSPSSRMSRVHNSITLQNKKLFNQGCPRAAMLQGWVVIAVALGYIGLLFVIASYGDRMRGAQPRPRADDHLSAVAGDLLHVLDVLRLGRARLAHRLRLPHHLYRPDADDRPLLAADRAHRAARQGAEHHLDRRLHRGALRQEPGGRRDRRADRDHRHHSLHRAAAQSGVVLARHDPRAHHADR